MKGFEIGNDCSKQARDEGSELVAVTFTNGVGGITFKLCAKHSETIAPELMRIYHYTRLRYAEERDKARREAKEREELEAKERWLGYEAELKPKLLSALDRGNDTIEPVPHAP